MKCWEVGRVHIGRKHNAILPRGLDKSKTSSPTPTPPPSPHPLEAASLSLLLMDLSGNMIARIWREGCLLIRNAGADLPKLYRGRRLFCTEGVLHNTRARICKYLKGHTYQR